LIRLQKNYNATLVVIGPGEVDLGGLNKEIRLWNANTEVSDLQSCHIGLLPLDNKEYNEWKFFYKIIQYMGVGIPVIAQEKRCNIEVIKNGVNGYLVDSKEDWYNKIEKLIIEPQLIEKMGANARNLVEEKYSEKVQIPRMLNVFNATLNNN